MLGIVATFLCKLLLNFLGITTLGLLFIVKLVKLELELGLELLIT